MYKKKSTQVQAQRTLTVNRIAHIKRLLNMANRTIISRVFTSEIKGVIFANNWKIMRNVILELSNNPFIVTYSNILNDECVKVVCDAGCRNNKTNY